MVARTELRDNAGRFARFKDQTFNDKGYIRIWYGKNRLKYAHRVVMANVLRYRRICLPHVFPKLESDGLPAGFHVNHFDWDKTHNCAANLQLLQDCIHDAITQSSRKYIRDHIDEFIEHEMKKVERENMPDWVLEDVV